MTRGPQGRSLRGGVEWVPLRAGVFGNDTGVWNVPLGRFTPKSG